MKLFGGSKKAVKKWRMRGLFIDLHKTRITIDEPNGKHVPPWIFKRLMAHQEEKHV